MTNSIGTALARVSALIGQSFANYEKQFKIIQQVPCGERILKRISDSNNEEQLKDYLAEIQYALIFSALQFQIEVEPLGKGKVGPDLKIIKNGNSALVEIARFQPINPGPPSLADLSETDLELMDYGDIKKDIRKCYEKINSKFRQIEGTKLNAIIAIWNDDQRLEDIECMGASRRIQRDCIMGKIPFPPNLSFILYGSYWINLRNKQQLYCFPIGNQEPFILGWQEELEKSIVSNLLQRVIE
jgi:hypothetical protein